MRDRDTLILEDLYEKEIKSVEVYDKLFKELQMLQRGKPESMFDKTRNPGSSNSNLYAEMLEHTGDLIHRASYPKFLSGWGGKTGWDYGCESTKNKVKLCLRRVDNDHRWDSEILDNVKANWREKYESGSYKGSEEEYMNESLGAAKRYAEAYRELPFYTVLQEECRRAAIMLGKMQWVFYKDALYNILELVDKGEEGYLSYLPI